MKMMKRPLAFFVLAALPIGCTGRREPAAPPVAPARPVVHATPYPRSLESKLVGDAPLRKSYIICADEASWVGSWWTEVLQSDVRFQPAASGIQIVEIAEHSIVSDRGFQKGDVVTVVNGRPIVCEAVLQNLFVDPRMRGSDSFTVDVNRGGEKIVLFFACKKAR